MPGKDKGDPINFREELRDMFLDYAYQIMREVVEDLKQNMETGIVANKYLVSPEVRAARDAVFLGLEPDEIEDDETDV